MSYVMIDISDDKSIKETEKWLDDSDDPNESTKIKLTPHHIANDFIEYCQTKKYIDVKKYDVNNSYSILGTNLISFFYEISGQKDRITKSIFLKFFYKYHGCKYEVFDLLHNGKNVITWKSFFDFFDTFGSI